MIVSLYKFYAVNSMMFKPLSFKGPLDHLNHFFTDSQLFEGFKLLQHSIMIDWHYDQARQQITAELAQTENSSKGRISCTISWPLIDDGFLCSCGAERCAHLAAISIESKQRIDVIAYQVKEHFDDKQLWRSIQQQLRQNWFEPYPNMARHRVVYLLKRDELNHGFFVQCYKAYLTQDNRYQLKEKLDYANLSIKKLPKFITLLDQQLLVSFTKNRREEDIEGRFNLTHLDDKKLERILNTLFNSRRVFWKACSRPPLRFQVLSEGFQELASEGLTESITHSFQLDVSHNRIIKVEKSDDRKPFPVLPITPCIKLISKYIELDYAGDKSRIINAAKVYFKDQSNREYSFGDIDKFHEFSQIHSVVAGFLKQLQHITTVFQTFEFPYSEHFDLADRAIEGPLSSNLVWLHGLTQLGWHLSIDSNFSLNSQPVQQWSLEVSEDDQWFNLSLGVKVNNQRFNILPALVDAIKNKTINISQLNQLQDLTLPLSDGQFIQLPAERLKAIVSTLMELFERNPLTKDGQLSLNTHQLTRVGQVIEQSEKQDWKDIIYTKDAFTHLNDISLNAVKTNHDFKLNATLREYQVEGIQWLTFLKENQLGGILADDMGLGKTLQTLAFVQSCKSHSPSLVVAPTSLLSNWLSEAHKFTPDLSVYIYYGSQRHESLNDLLEYDLIITSYGVLQRDIETLTEISFEHIFLDEAQAIKNAKTKVARCCFKLNGKFRACLTGTPIENHLGELWSLFNFLMPGYLASEKVFTQMFRQPIEREQDNLVYKSLINRVSPFILRRTKQAVAKELPEKVEIERSFELTESQADFYEAVRLAMTEEIQKAVHAQSNIKNQILISNALLRLRQICCHPQLIDWPSAQAIEDSVKLEWLLQVLPEMIEEGRKILLFSSFRKMLDIIAKKLHELNIDYLTLTGQSKNRGDIVEKFQTGKIPIFLISLKAGGAGLNLTAADTVIHFDPWWNPAAESQASDRAYRIGQNKSVFVYKLITRGTVEERIQTLQKSKSALSDQLYADSLTSISQLNEQNWQQLLEPLSTRLQRSE